MAENIDIHLQGNDLYIANGDFAASISDVQHVADTMNAFPGWWKENPPDGVGIFSFLNSAGREQELSKKTKIQLQSDGYQVSNPQISTDANGVLTINPNATRNA